MGGWGGDAEKGKLLPLIPDAFPIFQRNRRRQNHAELETKFKQTPHEPPYCLVSFNSLFQGCRHKNAHIMPFFLGKLGPLVPPPSVCPAAKKFPPFNQSRQSTICNQRTVLAHSDLVIYSPVLGVPEQLQIKPRAEFWHLITFSKYFLVQEYLASLL